MNFLTVFQFQRCDFIALKIAFSFRFLALCLSPLSLVLYLSRSSAMHHSFTLSRNSELIETHSLNSLTHPRNGKSISRRWHYDSITTPAPTTAKGDQQRLQCSEQYGMITECHEQMQSVEQTTNFLVILIACVCCVRDALSAKALIVYFNYLFCILSSTLWNHSVLGGG